MCGTTHSYVSRLIHMCAITHLYMRHDSFEGGARRSVGWGVDEGAWLIYMCVMSHSYEWHDSFIWVTWLIYMCDLTFSKAERGEVWGEALMKGHDSFICVTWLIYMCDMTHLYVWFDSFEGGARRGVGWGVDVGAKAVETSQTTFAPSDWYSMCVQNICVYAKYIY